jgi:hypothetical protein
MTKGSCVGETRPTARRFTVEFPVTVTIEWPVEVPYSDEDVIDVALCMVSSSSETNIGPPGTIVWAKCYAEVDENDALILEHEIVAVPGPKHR